jgi:rubrerythrin
MSKIIEHLKNAFAGESQANRKYLAFAKKADEDGFPQIARLFRAVAHAETIHAHNHLKAMDGVRTTAENLQEAIGGENYEVVSMYPPMLADAEAEGDRGRKGARGALPEERRTARPGQGRPGGRVLRLPGVRIHTRRADERELPGVRRSRLQIREDVLIRGASALFEPRSSQARQETLRNPFACFAPSR